MPWIESHQKLERHPKLLDLCNKTGWNKDEALGKLHRLWWWTLDFAEDGVLKKYNPHQYLSPLTNDKLPAEKLLNILKDTNFIDKDGKIHHWWDYAGRYLKGKYKTSNPKRLKEIQKIYKVDLRQTKD